METQKLLHNPLLAHTLENKYRENEARPNTTTWSLVKITGQSCVMIVQCDHQQQHQCVFFAEC